MKRPARLLFRGFAGRWCLSRRHRRHRERSNVPDLDQTDRYLDILRDAGVAPSFLHMLVEKGYVTTPGKLWASRYELIHVFHADIVTGLMEPWRPEPRRVPSTSSMIESH